MKILTYNIRSWYRDTNPKKETYWKTRALAIRHLIYEEEPDIILLQEALCPMTSAVIPQGYVKASGCSISHHIFIRKGLAEVEHREWHLHWCNALLRFPDATRLNVCSVHSHWNPKVMSSVEDDLYLKYREGYPIICGGDWNNTPRDVLINLFPMSLEGTGEITFRNWETGKTAELDYFAYSGLNPDLPRRYGDFTMSDHLPVVINI